MTFYFSMKRSLFSVGPVQRERLHFPWGQVPRHLHLDFFPPGQSDERQCSLSICQGTIFLEAARLHDNQGKGRKTALIL